MGEDAMETPQASPYFNFSLNGAERVRYKVICDRCECEEPVSFRELAPTRWNRVTVERIADGVIFTDISYIICPQCRDDVNECLRPIKRVPEPRMQAKIVFGEEKT